MLNGKVALVTGGSGAIGQAICRRLAAQGARLAVHYCHGEEAAQSLVNELHESESSSSSSSSTCQDHFVLRADLSDADQIQEMVGQAMETTHQRLDILVNNAGIALKHPPLLETTNYQEWQDCFQKTLQTNLVGPANLCYCAAPYMTAGGRIINISSRGAFRGEPDYPAYGASKAGLNSLSQSLAVALAPQGISVFAIAPGFVETPMARPFLEGEAGVEIRNQSPLGRVATPDEVAYWVSCLAAPDAAFATGAIIDVNGASYLR